MDAHFQEKIQQVIDEYVGAMGSAVIVSRKGDLVFHSTHDDSAYALAPIIKRVPCESFDSLSPTVISVAVDESSCGFAVALGDSHVLLVVTELGIGQAVASTRVMNAARCLSLVLRGNAAAPADGGTSGAPAQLTPRTPARS